MMLSKLKNRMKTAILISVNEEKINLPELIKYLKSNDHFYWPLNRIINPNKFNFPINCYLHICKADTAYKLTIESIMRYSKDLFNKINKPKILSKEILEKFRKLDTNECKRKGIMIISSISKLNEPIKTSSLQTRRGAFVVFAPQQYYEIQEP